ncbi:MAG: protein kinase domain-containing protein, partial [Gemmataceae bacterium]
VHRDVKPENIIMKPGKTPQEWEPHLTDFDLAWFSTATIQTNDALGTVFYAAPEQLAKPNTASSRSKVVDVYSIGQVFYYLLSKSNPVPMEMANNARAFGERLKSWGSVRPAELMVSLYQDCTRHNPAQRIQSMEEVARRLFDVRAAFSHKSPSAVLTREEFVREVRFAIVGLADADNSWEFRSPAGLAKITLSFENRHLSIGFQVSRKPLVDNVAEYRKGRDILNQRLETLLRNMPKVWRKSGRENPYEVFVNVNDLPLTFSEVAEIRDLTVKVLGVLEKG